MQNHENILNRGEQTNLQKDPDGHLRLGWESVKRNVFPCLAPVGWIGEELGTEMEKQMASSDFLDLAVYYYIKLENRSDDRMAIAWVNRKLLERWGISM